MPDIYYFAFPTPTTGGDFVNVEHVHTLQEMGLPATMVVPGQDFDRQRLPGNTRLINQTVFRKEDYLVIPENDPGIIAFAQKVDCNVVVHNQNTLYLFAAIRSIHELDCGRFGTIICPSLGGAAVLQRSGYTGSVNVITPGIPEYFQPQEKTLRIAYSPRKLPAESRAVMSMFRSMYPEYADVPWCEISGMDRMQVANVLGGSAVYAAFSHNESIALSVLEAMRSGCIVAGSNGGAGHDYASDHNGMWVPSASDIVGFARQIHRAIVLFERHGQTNEVSRQGIATAQRYGMPSFRKALADFWKPRCP